MNGLAVNLHSGAIATIPAGPSSAVPPAVPPAVPQRELTLEEQQEEDLRSHVYLLPDDPNYAWKNLPPEAFACTAQEAAAVDASLSDHLGRLHQMFCPGRHLNSIGLSIRHLHSQLVCHGSLTFSMPLSEPFAQR
jgi:hypothetical protein